MFDLPDNQPVFSAGQIVKLTPEATSRFRENKDPIFYSVAAGVEPELYIARIFSIKPDNPCTPVEYQYLIQYNILYDKDGGFCTRSQRNNAIFEEADLQISNDEMITTLKEETSTRYASSLPNI